MRGFEPSASKWPRTRSRPAFSPRRKGDKYEISFPVIPRRVLLHALRLQARRHSVPRFLAPSALCAPPESQSGLGVHPTLWDTNRVPDASWMPPPALTRLEPKKEKMNHTMLTKRDLTFSVTPVPAVRLAAGDARSRINKRDSRAVQREDQWLHPFLGIARRA